VLRQELRVLVYPSSIDLSSHTLRYLTMRLRARQREIGTRWRRLRVGRQALLALDHLRCGDTYARLATGVGIGVATVYRYIREVIDVLAATALPLTEAMKTVRAKAFVILHGTLLPIDRIAADTPYYSGKHARHLIDALAEADVKCWAGKAYQGAGRLVRVPFRGRRLKRWMRRHNSTHTQIRCLGEQAMAALKSWCLRGSSAAAPTGITAIVKAVVVLHHVST
jgi:hypothetical protein